MFDCFRCSCVDHIVGCSNLSLDQPGASYTQSAECGLGTNLPINQNNLIRGDQKQKSGQSWYARLSDEKKTEYIQRQRIARQQKKAATQSGVNCVAVSQTPAASLLTSQRTPLSNVTNTYANDTHGKNLKSHQLLSIIYFLWKLCVLREFLC